MHTQRIPELQHTEKEAQLFLTSSMKIVTNFSCAWGLQGSGSVLKEAPHSTPCTSAPAALLSIKGRSREKGNSPNGFVHSCKWEKHWDCRALHRNHDSLVLLTALMVCYCSITAFQQTCTQPLSHSHCEPTNCVNRDKAHSALGALSASWWKAEQRRALEAQKGTNFMKSMPSNLREPTKTRLKIQPNTLSGEQNSLR